MKSLRGMGALGLGLALAFGPAVAWAMTYDLKEKTPAVEAALSGRQQRFSQLATAKSQGLVGENAQGLVAQLGGGADIAALAAAENQDRTIIYQAIVEQNGLAAGALPTVQQAFAEVQRDRAAAGDPIQNPSGEWTKK